MDLGKACTWMAGLTDGWKGPGSVAPPLRSIQNFEAFVALTIKSPSHVGVASDGEIIARYRLDDGRDFEISFHSDDDISAAFLPGNN